MKLLPIILIFFCSSVFAKSSPEPILFLRNGIYHYGSIVLDSKQNTPDSFIISQKKYLSNYNMSESSLKLPRSEVIRQSSSITVSLQGAERVLQKGTIVLNKDSNPCIVEAVFPNGKMLLNPLEISSVSRFRIKENSNFATKRGVNVEVASATDITAVEQQCFSTIYCKGTVFKQTDELGGKKICPSLPVNNEEKSILASCRSSTQPQLGAVFSDGTLLIDMKLVKPFDVPGERGKVDGTGYSETIQ